MRLLIITQAVDLDNPILGFFHGWIKEFSKYAEHIDIICLESGRSDLPKNARVYSLGKEKSVSRLGYVLNFYTYLWRLRKDYDTVFIHMNQEYVLLGGILWRMLGKQVLFWRNHKKGNIFTDLAVAGSHRVFYTSPESYTAQFAKASKMPVGIDTDIFIPRPDIQTVPHSILFLGRISPVKKADLFVKALRALVRGGFSFRATIAGDPINPEDVAYEKEVKRMADAFGLTDMVTFKKGVRNEETAVLYNAHEVYVNLTPAGSMDKTILEAMACGAIPVVANTAFQKVLPAELIVDKPDEGRVADAIGKAFARTDSFRNYVVAEHGLKRLAKVLFEEYNN